MADDVLLLTVLPNLWSPTQGTLAVKDRSCYVRDSFYLLREKDLLIFFSPFADLSIPFSLPGTLVSAMEVVPVCFCQHCANKVGSCFFLVAVASHFGTH